MRLQWNYDVHAVIGRQLALALKLAELESNTVPRRVVQMHGFSGIRPFNRVDKRKLLDHVQALTRGY